MNNALPELEHVVGSEYESCFILDQYLEPMFWPANHKVNLSASKHGTITIHIMLNLNQLDLMPWAKQQKKTTFVWPTWDWTQPPELGGDKATQRPLKQFPLVCSEHS